MTTPRAESTELPDDAVAQLNSEKAPTGDPRADRVAAAVRVWRRQLVDLGGRNTLLWFRDLPSGTLDLSTAHPGGVSMLMAGRPTRLSDIVRERTAFVEARRRAGVIRAKMTELREERGIDTGYIAIGMATWTMPGATGATGTTGAAGPSGATGTRAPSAPVLLRSCALRPTAAAQQDFDLGLGSDVEVNPVLLQYLATEHGITLDPDALADLAHVTRLFDPAPVFREITRRCAGLPGFRIADRKVIGTFSYAKLPLVADLDALGSTMAEHDVVAALAGDPHAMAVVRSEPALPAYTAQPSDPDLDREVLVLDADSRQQAAIEAARAGGHLVIQGPPGTGKSQTIANIVAALAADGKSVLVVAEKRAALDAVTDRLATVGLGGLVLDAHDGVHNRRQVTRDIAASLADGDPRGADVATLTRDHADLEHSLEAHRRRLSAHQDTMHRLRQPWDVSVFEAQTAIAQLTERAEPPSTRVRLRGEVLRAVTRADMERLCVELTTAIEHGAWTPTHAADERASADPWFGARVTTAEDASRAARLVSRLADGDLDATRARLDAVLTSVGLPPATTPSDWGTALDLVRRVETTASTFLPAVLTTPLGSYLTSTGDSAYRHEHPPSPHWWARLSLKREAKALVIPGVHVPDVHAALVEVDAQREAWSRLARPATPVTAVLAPARPAADTPAVPEGLATAASDWAALRAYLVWLSAILGTTSEGGDLLTTDLDALADRVRRLADHPDRLAVLPTIIPILDRLSHAGLGRLVDDLAARAVSASAAADELAFVWWTSILDDIGVTDPAYGGHQGVTLRSVVAEYQRLDHAHIRAGADRVRAAVRHRLVQVLAAHPEQEALVRAEAGKVRRHLALRDVLPQTSDVLTAAKPCWIMSPLVVASLLPPGRWFDTVIFDEASQIAPSQAVSAIARAGQVIVVGDERQLPPTSFFTAAVEQEVGIGDEEPARADDVESVLDRLAPLLPVVSLSWHYRSRDERLVAFANEHVYDGRLVTFPGAGLERPVRLVHVSTRRGEGEDVPIPALADPGETSAAEVATVVELALEHARRHPEETLGVIALGIRHANRLHEAVRIALDTERDPAVVDFFAADRPERFFVKNLERVQGDERDAIILSIGYGRTSDGRVLHRFGPLSVEGGERRLNVAITRARRRMTVVSAITAGDLDESRLSAGGARMLRSYLQYAEAGGSLPSATSEESVRRDPRDALMAELAARLRAEGLVVHEGYGASEQVVDLAVEDPYVPGRLVVAVESDGRRSAELSSARDRERLRPEQLRRRGWQHVRVWSTDVFRDPVRDVARVVEAVRVADVTSAWRVERPAPAGRVSVDSARAADA